jgi:hypothetical protein
VYGKERKKNRKVKRKNIYMYEKERKKERKERRGVARKI